MVLDMDNRIDIESLNIHTENLLVNHSHVGLCRMYLELTVNAHASQLSGLILVGSDPAQKAFCYSSKWQIHGCLFG